MVSVHAKSGGGGTFERLLEALTMRNRGLRMQRVRAAFLMAQEMYGDRKHWTGSDLLTHAMGVLEALLPFQPDEDAVIACLLQHSLDVSDHMLDEVQGRFGADVRIIVSGVHLLSHVTMRNRRMSMDNLRLMFLEVSDDIRVILIALCAHSYALDQIPRLSEDEAKRLCKDSLALFSPVAARLGIYSLKQSVESRAFPVLYPTDSQRIAQQMHDLHEKHGRFLRRVMSKLKAFLEKEGVHARIEAREKQAYSVFQKMQDKSINHVEELYDLFALRVIVEHEADCYQVLGLLHRIGHPVQHRFKDYLAFPKPNGYRSLHTTLARLPGIPDGLCVEVQVRTEQMHREAEFGIAAHWSYKEGDVRPKDRLTKTLAFRQEAENGRASLMADHIFVLTPKGDIIELPEGATPLDFAFQVHTNLGLTFRAARVNGAIVPLAYHLENGDIVEILRYREPHPSPRWSTLLRTASARSRLKKYFAHQDLPAHVAVGREMLNEELEDKGLPPLDPDLSLLRVLDGKTLTLQEREEVLANVGQGTVRVQTVLQQLPGTKTPSRRRLMARKEENLSEGSVIESDIPMPVRFAKCCKPDEGPRSSVIGIASRTGELRVHRSHCALIKSGNPERRVKVRWVARAKTVTR